MNFSDQESLKSSWDSHWKILDVESSHCDAVAAEASSNTLTYRPIVNQILSMYERPHVLECGCGPAQWLYYVASIHHGTGVGLDIAPEILERASKARTLRPYIAKGSVQLLVGDMRDMPFPGETFDVIFSFGVVEHVVDADTQRTVREFERLLRPGGRALITTPNVFSVHTLTRPIAKAAGQWTVGYERSLTPRQIKSHVLRAGLEVESYGVLESGDMFGAALNARAPFLRNISRLIEKKQKTFGFLSYCIAMKPATDVDCGLKSPQ